MNPDFSIKDSKEELLAEISRLRIYLNLLNKTDKIAKFRERDLTDLTLENQSLKSLCLRAAEALEETRPDVHAALATKSKWWHTTEPLIAELRQDKAGIPEAADKSGPYVNPID